MTYSCSKKKTDKTQGLTWELCFLLLHQNTAHLFILFAHCSADQEGDREGHGAALNVAIFHRPSFKFKALEISLQGHHAFLSLATRLHTLTNSGGGMWQRGEEDKKMTKLERRKIKTFHSTYPPIMIAARNHARVSFQDSLQYKMLGR